MASDQNARRRWAIPSALVLLALAFMEWWTSTQLGVFIVPAGVASGMCLMGGLLLLGLFSHGHHRGWATAMVGAIAAVTEMTIGVVVLSTLAGMTVLVLPHSVSARLFQGDSATDLVVFTLVGLSLLVAARSWSRYAQQQYRVAQASLQAAEARSAVAEKDKELAQSQLMLLRAQVEPHFLWNTLAHVQYLIRKNPDDAGRMTGHLIHYLRAAVPQMRGDVSSVGNEVASVSAYLELMKIRMGERLTVDVQCPEDIGACPFAPLLIQTLVENAIKHGVEPKVGLVKVLVRAFVDAGSRQLVVEVQDNGVGLQVSPATRGTGLGLRGARERIKLLYGDSATLSVAGAHGGGVLARISIPHPPAEDS